ncbi:hypothetical protein ACFQY7_11255 [Actinomadura luteofluorescens]
MTAAEGLLHLAGVDERLSFEEARDLARAMLAVAAHASGSGLREGSGGP